MTPLLFVCTLSTLLIILFVWAFRTLHREHWQFLATIPIRKSSEFEWEGLNLTYYGFFSATATSVGVALFLFLLGTIGLPAGSVLALSGIIVVVGLLAARGIARVVEKKKHTFTVSGASFAGFLLTPVVIYCLQLLDPAAILPLIPIMGAAMASYTVAESIGRLACISFGCCYGKRLADLPAWSRRVLQPFAVSFKGPTKKIAYEAGWEGVSVVPIQAITALIFAVTGLTGIYLFLHAAYTEGFICTTTVALGWRFISEMLRSDYRGVGQISKYQWLSLFMIVLSIAFSIIFSTYNKPTPDVTQGLLRLWNPIAFILLQIIWICVFIYMGRSTITGAHLSFHVRKERV